MCAECHSTHLQKNYDPVHKSFDTRWSEIDVSCEACHGPGALHVDWAKQKARLGKTGRQQGTDRWCSMSARCVHWQPDAGKPVRRSAVNPVRAVRKSRCVPAAMHAAVSSPLVMCTVNRCWTITCRGCWMPACITRWPDSGRGVCLRLVPAEPHASGRCHLQRLP